MKTTRMIKMVFGAALAALMLVGCGEDTTAAPGGSSASNKPTEYSTLEEAGACAPSRYGETVFVTSEGEFYFCGGKKWTVIDDGEDEGQSSAKRSSGSGEQQTVSSENGSSEGDESGTGTSQTASSDKQTTSSSQREDYVPHKPDILQWGTDYTTVTINDTVKFTLMYLTDANGLDDIKRYDWNFGDGSTLRKRDSSSVRHAYAETGRYTVSITVTDSNGDSETESMVITVTNPRPTVDAGPAKQCYNATSCAFSATAYDSDRGFIRLYEWDFDGNGSIDASGATNSFSHVYPDTSSSARYVAKFCATDDDDNRVCDTTTVNVANRAPTLIGNIAMTVEGANIVFRATQLSISDPENNHRDSLWWDFDNDGVFETATRRTDVVTRAVAATSRTVKVRTRDKWGAVSNVITGTGPSYSNDGTGGFDYSRANAGSGFMAVDGAWQGCTGTGYNCDFSYAKVEAKHFDGRWYTMGPGLPATATPGYQTCPYGDSDGDGNSDCYPGWNLDDGITDTAYTVRVTLGAYVNPTGWGYTNGGLIYILDGVQLATANYVDLGNGDVTVEVWAEAGKPLKVYAMDQGYLAAEPYAEVGTMKCSFTGTGAWQTKTCRASDFAAYVGTTNSYTPHAVKAIAVEYELAARGGAGEAFPAATAATNATLSWKSLVVNSGRPLRYLGE